MDIFSDYNVNLYLYMLFNQKWKLNKLVMLVQLIPVFKMHSDKSVHRFVHTNFLPYIYMYLIFQ